MFKAQTYLELRMSKGRRQVNMLTFKFLFFLEFLFFGSKKVPLLLIERVICGEQACTVVLVLLQLKQAKTVMFRRACLSYSTAFKLSLLKKADPENNHSSYIQYSSHKETNKRLIHQSELFP